MSPRIQVLQHDPLVPPGLLAASLPADTVVVRLDLGEPLPRLEACSAIVSLGGRMGAYDGSEYPFIDDEKRFLRAAHDAGIPVLGVCLGCQLLADALGGSAYPAPKREVRFGPCDLTPQGSNDPVGRHLAAPVLTLHQDTWDTPPGADLLAETTAHPQAFRLGRSIGIQPHPEVTPEIVSEWIRLFGTERIVAAGADPVDLLNRLESHRTESADLAKSLFDAWVASIDGS